jgi:hypothetical protein
LSLVVVRRGEEALSSSFLNWSSFNNWQRQHSCDLCSAFKRSQEADQWGNAQFWSNSKMDFDSNQHWSSSHDKKILWVQSFKITLFMINFFWHFISN